MWCEVTHDNKLLITISREDYAIEEKFETKDFFFLTKWSIRTKKRLHTSEIDLEGYVGS